MNIFIVFCILLILTCFVWKYIYSPLFKLKSKFSLKIRESIYPQIQTSVNTIISLSSAAIVVTFTIIKVFNINLANSKSYLVFSWIGFTIAITLGVFVLILQFVILAKYKVIIQTLENTKTLPNTKEDLKSNKEDIPYLSWIFKSLNVTEPLLFWFLFMQSISFVFSIVLLLFFTAINI